MAIDFAGFGTVAMGCSFFCCTCPAILCAIGTTIAIAMALGGDAYTLSSSSDTWCHALVMEGSERLAASKIQTSSIGQAQLNGFNATLMVRSSGCVYDANAMEESSMFDDWYINFPIAIGVFISLRAWKAYLQCSGLFAGDADSSSQERKYQAEEKRKASMQYILFGSLTGGPFKKVFGVVGMLADYLVTTFLTTACLAPLASAKLSENATHIIMMSFDQWVWRACIIMSAAMGSFILAMPDKEKPAEATNDERPKSKAWVDPRIQRAFLRVFIVILVVGVLVCSVLYISNVNIAAFLFIDLRLIFEISLNSGVAACSTLLRLFLFFMSVGDSLLMVVIWCSEDQALDLPDDGSTTPPATTMGSEM